MGKMQDIINNIDENWIKEYYKNHTRKELAEFLNISPGSTSHIIKYFGLNKEKKTSIVNEEFFMEDTPERAYILGYIVGDGCIRSKRTGQREINIWSKDTQILEDISSVISYTGSLKSGINFRSNLVSQTLEDLGIVSKKSVLGGEVKYPKHYANHYLRGLFDSDGCVTTQNSGLRLYFFGHEDTMNQVLDILREDLDIVKHSRKRKDNIYEVGIYDQSSIIKIFNYMYQNATIYLKRKYDKFMVKI